MIRSPLAFAVLALFAACSSETAGPRPLRVSFLPDANPDKLREGGARFAAWLSGEIGIPVEVIPVQDYSAAVSAIVSGDQDLAWLGGVTTVQAMRQSEGRVLPLITRKSDLEFKSYFIVGAGVEAKSIKDLQGKRFAFGSIGSTSGHVMPRHFLREQFGVDAEQFFSHVAYSGAHDKTVEQVVSGVVDAGAVNFKTYDTLVASGKLDPSKARILWTTPTYVDYSWAARNDLDQRHSAGLKARIKAAFLALDAGEPADRQILDLQHCSQYIAAEVSWWDGIASVLQALDAR